MNRQKIIIMGAAGRDFHNFNMVYRNDPAFEVVAFTAAQLPDISDRTYPPDLAGPLYPNGIRIFPEERLESLISAYHVQQVVFAYSDVSYEYLMHKASACLSSGADFIILGPDKTMLASERPVISVCAVRTGCGKSGISVYISKILKGRGIYPAVVRHPMPYGPRIIGGVRRYAKMDDFYGRECTIEEREEYEPLVEAGLVVYSGVDCKSVLRSAEKEAPMIIWDGGNNDMPFVKPDIEIVVLDPHRPGHELRYHPGEANLRRAHIAVINKVNTAERKKVEAVEQNIRKYNPEAAIVHTVSEIILENGESVTGKKVLVVEDGPTLTHGGMPYGAGYLAAVKSQAVEILDPRPYSRGSIKQTFARYPQIRNVLPAVGYSPNQLAELRETIENTPCDIVIMATPVDLGKLLTIKHEICRVRYEIRETEYPELKGYIEGFADSHIHSLT